MILCHKRRRQTSHGPAARVLLLLYRKSHQTKSREGAVGRGVFVRAHMCCLLSRKVVDHQVQVGIVWMTHLV